MNSGLNHIRGTWTIAVAGIVAVSSCAPTPEPQSKTVSRFGEYAGYSEAQYDGWNRYSNYVTSRNGTRLAVDYFLPTREGEEASEPLPVILHYTRYVRAIEGDEGVQNYVEFDPVLQHMLKHGYAVAVADTPGSGASFGTREMEFSVEEAAAGYDIIEWLAAQPWCNGNIGMHGRSYPGMTQYHAATLAPPHLKAIFAEMAGPSVYDFIYRGGTYKEDFINQWGEGTKEMDLGKSRTPARVDEDADGSLRDASLIEHAGNGWVQDLAGQAVFRDWIYNFPSGDFTSWNQLDTIDNAADIDASGVAVYHLVGWFDIYTSQQPMLYSNLRSTPQKMIIGPWTHSGGYGGQIHLTEFLRWYDYWLKGIDNGIMNEPPVHYWMMGGNNSVPTDASQKESWDEMEAEDGVKWTTSAEWPPADISSRRYYLSAGPSGSVDSTNDGTLLIDRPVDGTGRDDYTVDYTSTTGSLNRWRNGYGARREEPEGTTFFDERTPENEKALTYTTAPFGKALEVVGYPVVHLWVASSHADGDFFVYLEEVDAEGSSHYVTEGALRASYRALSEAPWNNFGLPFLRGHGQDLTPLPNEPTELVFDLMGTAIVIDAGHRLRVTIAGADADNHALFPDPADGVPNISVYRTGEYSSYVELPRLGPE